jgi:hypothetical protein
MKGPGNRIRHDVRRIWECPACGRREKTSGQVVCLRCNCVATGEPPSPPWMRLVEDRAAKPLAAGPTEPIASGEQPPQGPG